MEAIPIFIKESRNDEMLRLVLPVFFFLCVFLPWMDDG